MKTRIVLVVTIAVLLLEACAKSNGGGSNNSESPEGGASLLTGAWKDSCKTWGGGDYQSSSYNIATFKDSTLVIAGDTFKSADCSGEKTASMKATYSYEVPSRSPIGPDFFDFNVVLNRITYLITDQDTANMMNTMAYCGFTDWVIGVEKDITDKPCFTGPKSGEKVYSIVKTTGTQFQVGEPDEAHNGTTPELRHVQLAPESFSKISLEYQRECLSRHSSYFESIDSRIWLTS